MQDKSVIDMINERCRTAEKRTKRSMDMKRTFTKMQGCGNDYIYFNCFDGMIAHPEEVSIRLSDRRFGVGGDGAIFICRSSIADAEMRMFNLDGSEGKMCGNGIRCVAKYLYDYGLVKKEKMTIATRSGIKRVELFFKNDVVDSVRVDMGEAILDGLSIPTTLDQAQIVDEAIEIDEVLYRVTCVSVGNPHAVIFGGDPALLDIACMGEKLQQDPFFPESVNVEFVHVVNRTNVNMRVFERGSGETLACGTGACAVAVACVLNGYCDYDTEITVHVRGGDLIVSYEKNGRVWLKGEARTVFEGTVEIDKSLL